MASDCPSVKLQEEGDDQELTGEDVKYWSVVASENCKAQDHPDRRFAVKELSQLWRFWSNSRFCGQRSQRILPANMTMLDGLAR